MVVVLGDELGLHRQQCGLGPIIHTELAQNIADMEAHRAMADAEVRGDRHVGLAHHEQGQHIAFTPR